MRICEEDVLIRPGFIARAITNLEIIEQEKVITKPVVLINEEGQEPVISQEVTRIQTFRSKGSLWTEVISRDPLDVTLVLPPRYPVVQAALGSGVIETVGSSE